MRFAQVGNFGPAHSTENELRKAITAAGHESVSYQENERHAFRRLARDVANFDAVLWTRTVWPNMDFEGMRRMIAAARKATVPVVGYHLDIWHGLRRSTEIGQHPFFTVDLLCTADGGHDPEWERIGVRHRWLPPAVSAEECEPGRPRPDLAADVAFVGSWQGYHAEHQHRAELVDWLRRDGRCRFWPAPGEHAVRGAALRDLYATTKVNVGDSCFAGLVPNYWSDRIPETLGRGGFLLHPWVPGIEAHFTDGEHLRLWPAGDWRELRRLIDHYLAHDDERRRIAQQGRAHVLERHTYTVRIAQLVEHLAGVAA